MASRNDDAPVLDELLERLRSEGAPEGTWLVEIGQARDSLRRVDDLLRRLEVALIAKAANDA